MKRFEPIIVILAAASLWGLFEILPIPTGILCAIGIVFLVLARSLVHIPGSSTLIGLIVCVFKMYSAHFLMCQTAGVMSLAISFDIFAILLWKNGAHRHARIALIAALSAIAALPVFVVWVTYVTPISFWVEGGWERIAGYALHTTLPAVLLGVPAAIAAMALGNRLRSGSVLTDKAFTVRFLTPAIVVAWGIASAVQYF